MCFFGTGITLIGLFNGDRGKRDRVSRRMLFTLNLALFTNLTANVNDLVTFFASEAGAGFLSLTLKFSTNMVVCISVVRVFMGTGSTLMKTLNRMGNG